MEQKLIIKEICKKRFEPVVMKIKELLTLETDCIIVTIDGMSASGKSTLGFYLKEIFECNLFHMDDFFLQDYQHTKERLSEIGGNVDYERFKEEVVIPILKKETVFYRPFSCKIREIQNTIEIPFRRLNIIEGSYSQHPYFNDAYTQYVNNVSKLQIFTEISNELQIERIKNRNGEIMLERFLSEWIPKENIYFKTFEIKENSHILISK